MINIFKLFVCLFYLFSKASVFYVDGCFLIIFHSNVNWSGKMKISILFSISSFIEKCPKSWYWIFPPPSQSTSWFVIQTGSFNITLKHVCVCVCEINGKIHDWFGFFSVQLYAVPLHPIDWSNFVLDSQKKRISGFFSILSISVVFLLQSFKWISFFVALPLCVCVYVLFVFDVDDDTNLFFFLLLMNESDV